MATETTEIETITDSRWRPGTLSPSSPPRARLQPASRLISLLTVTLCLTVCLFCLGLLFLVPTPPRRDASPHTRTLAHPPPSMFRACRTVTKRVAPPPPPPRGLLGTWTASRSSATAPPPFSPAAATRPTHPLGPAAFLKQGRSFSSTRAAMIGAQTQKPQIVGKTEADEAAVRTALERLVVADGSSSTGRWVVTANGLGIERSFKFKNFTKTWVGGWTSNIHDGRETDGTLRTL